MAYYSSQQNWFKFMNIGTNNAYSPYQTGYTYQNAPGNYAQQWGLQAPPGTQTPTAGGTGMPVGGIGGYKPPEMTAEEAFASQGTPLGPKDPNLPTTAAPAGQQWFLPPGATKWELQNAPTWAQPDPGGLHFNSVVKEPAGGMDNFYAKLGSDSYSAMLGPGATSKSYDMIVNGQPAGFGGPNTPSYGGASTVLQNANGLYQYSPTGTSMPYAPGQEKAGVRMGGVTLPNMATPTVPSAAPTATGSAGYYGQSVYPNTQNQITYPQSWYSGQQNNFSDWSYLNQLNGIF